jgi:hypothetical protein
MMALGDADAVRRCPLLLADCLEFIGIYESDPTS